MSLYFDSAYVAKCYVNEPDSAPVRRVARDADQLCSSIWCVAEVACVLQRHVREKSLSVEQAGRLRRKPSGSIGKTASGRCCPSRKTYSAGLKRSCPSCRHPC